MFGLITITEIIMNQISDPSVAFLHIQTTYFEFDFDDFLYVFSKASDD